MPHPTNPAAHTRARHRLAMLLLCAAAGLGACGGGGDETSPPEPATPTSPPVTDLRATTATVAPSGGTIAADGLSLTFPADALAQAQPVTLVTQSTPADALARFRLEPAGLALRAPATVQYSAPGLPAQARLFWRVGEDSLLLPATRTTAGSFTTTIRSLGYTAAGTLAGAGGEDGRVQRLSASDPARRLAEAGGGAGVLEVRLLNCQAQADAVQRRLRATNWPADMDRAIALHDELVELQAACVDLQIAAIEQRACEAALVATQNAAVLAVDSFTSFHEIVRPLLTTAAMVQEVDADCPTSGGVPLHTLAEQLTRAKLEQLLSFVDAHIAQTGLRNENTWRELGVLLALDGECRVLSLDSACDPLRTHLYPRLLDELRRGAFNSCLSSGAQPVMQLLALRGALGGEGAGFGGLASYSDEALEADAVYCTNPGLSGRVFADATTVPEELSDRRFSLNALGNPVVMGQYTRNAAVKLPPAGSLILNLRVPPLRCADGSLRNDEMVLRVDGRELTRYPRVDDGYRLDTQPVEFVVERDLTRVGLTPGATNERTLTLVREGANCGTGEPDNSFASTLTMFTLALDLTPEETEGPPLPPSFPASEWVGSVTLVYNYTVEWDETRTSTTLFCGFLGSVACTNTRQGSYSGQLAYTLAASSQGVVNVNSSSAIQVTAGDVSGSMSGIDNRTYTGTSGNCTRSGSSNGLVSGTPVRAHASGNWRLLVHPNGELQLGASGVEVVHGTVVSATGSNTRSEGCDSPGTTPSSTPPGPGGELPVQLMLGSFRGLVDPGSNLWQGEETLDFARTGSTCESLIVNTPAEAHPQSVGSLRCAATVRARWELRRR